MVPQHDARFIQTQRRPSVQVARSVVGKWDDWGCTRVALYHNNLRWPQNTVTDAKLAEPSEGDELAVARRKRAAERCFCLTYLLVEYGGDVFVACGLAAFQ
ncbi:hypothetical protein D9M72_438590 [compost metagenome]